MAPVASLRQDVGVIVSTELIVAAASAVLSLASGLFSARASRRTKQLEYQIERQRKQDDAAASAERILHQYRDPLLDAAQTLQSRSANIVTNNYLGRFLHCGIPDEERYARDYTVYAFAEYMCWVEIVRRELRFLDVGDIDNNRKLLVHLNQTQLTLQSDRIAGPFQVFRGRQRAIAELMMIPTGATEGPRSEAIGYAAFCQRLDNDPDFAAWFKRLRDEVELVVGRDNDDRLIQLQNDLVDLIEHLDPKQLRIPPDYRRRLPRPPAAQPAPTQRG
jgi:hypothetical protein